MQRFFSFLFCLCLLTVFLALPSPATAQAAAKPTVPSLEAMIGQMVFVGFKGMDVDDPEMAPFLASLAKGHVGGVILFEPDYRTQKPRNIRSMTQVRALVTELQRRSPIPLFVAVDQEGGEVQRFKAEHGLTQMPSAKEMDTGTPKATRAAPRRIPTSACRTSQTPGRVRSLLPTVTCSKKAFSPLC